MRNRLALVIVLVQTFAFAARSPELPGIEVTDSEMALEQSKKLVQTQSAERTHLYENKGWTASNLEEQLNRDKKSIGMGQGAIFIPCFTESRLEPEYIAIRTDTLLKEDIGKEWTGKPGSRLVVPYGSYTVIMGSGIGDKKLEYKVKVEEGKTTLIPPEWGGLVINTINEDGEFVSESYEIFSVSDGESYGKGFGLTQERLNDVKTWILPSQVYRISRSGENASSILNYITVQVNPGELSHVELVFEESTGRLIAGGVHKIRINTSRSSHWTYGLRLGGSAIYRTALTADEQKSSDWNILGDLRLRALYNHPKVFWLTELYMREDMWWLNEEQEESQWSVAQDLLQFQSSVVYRFLEWLGPYTRVNVKTHIFPGHDWLNRIEINRRSDGIDDTITYKEKIRVSYPFDPLRIGEGVGLNLRPVVSNSADISAQIGFAARQTIRRRLKNLNSIKTQYTIASDNSYEYGWESSLNVRFYFLRFFTLDLIGEVFFPKATIRDYIVEELSSDLRIAITRFLELSYQQQLYDRMTEVENKKDIKGERFESLNTVQLRLYVNF